MKRTLSLLIVLVILIIHIPIALADGTMIDAILMLSSFLSRSDSVDYEIDDVSLAFDQFGNADRAIEFKFYCEMIKNVVDTKWNEAQNYIAVLETMRFDDYLTGNVFPEYMESHGVNDNEYLSIRPVSEVKLYVSGRVAYSDGRKNDAYNAFLNCYSFYDASDYLLKLVKEGGTSYTPTPASTVISVTPAPTSSQKEELPAISITNVKPFVGFINLSWEPIKGAVEYTVYQHIANGEKKRIYTGTDTSATDETVGYGITYYYTVEATLSDGRKTVSVEKQVLSPTAEPSKSVTEYAGKSVTEYRYRDLYTAYSDWSSWGDWSTYRIPNIDYSIMEEDTRVRYGWWAARCKNCGTNNMYWGSTTKCVSCGKYLPRDAMDSIIVYTTDPGTGTRTIDGQQYKRNNTDNDIIEYRYRIRSCYDEWGDWSEWSTTEPAEIPNREIATRVIEEAH